MSRLIDLTGQRFGRWTVLRKCDAHRKANVYWLCKCDCGTIKEVNGQSLRTGQTKSCGCLTKELISKANGRHRQTGSRLHYIWRAMRRRCYRKNDPKYERYGGRGITVCEEWHKYEGFRDWDIANGYRDDLTIDRKDNDGPYSPDNCRWTTQMEQQNNKSTNHFVEYRGMRYTLTQGERETGIKQSTIRHRLKSGWSVEDALTREVRKSERA